MLWLCAGAFAQSPEQKHFRIVDTLTAREQINRNTILLRAEVDSLIKLYSDKQAQLPLPVQQPLQEGENLSSSMVLVGLAMIITLLLGLLYLFYRQRQTTNKIIEEITNKPDPAPDLNGNTGKNNKGEIARELLENTIDDLNAAVLKLSKENEGLEGVIKEYNGIQHEYESLKHIMQKTYKVKNYPGYDKTKEENLAMRGVLDTENSIAGYAYENFLKPVLAIADSNKNNPAKVSNEERQKVLDLLISLSLLYIECLYLRVPDLAIGGKMVQRIQGFAKGKAFDAALLKKLNTESGNRALVLRMILDKANLHQLTYPVFDETNLNHP